MFQVSSLPPASPTPRRVRSPSWFDLRLVLGIALVLASMAVGALVLSKADSTHPVVAVDRDLAAGTVLTDDDLRVVRVRLTGSSAVYVSARSDAVGKVLQRALGSGDLVPVSALGTSTSDETTIAISVEPGNAPSISRGQRISVQITTQYCPTLVVLKDVTVQDVRSAGTGALSATSAQRIVVQVPTSLANRVFYAIGLPQVVVYVGIVSAPPQDNPNADLPSLAGCVAPSKSS